MSFLASFSHSFRQKDKTIFYRKVIINNLKALHLFSHTVVGYLTFDKAMGTEVEVPAK